MTDSEAYARVRSYVPWHQAEEPRSYDLALCHDDWRAWIDEAVLQLTASGMLIRHAEIVQLKENK